MSLTTNQIAEKFIEFPGYLERGAGFLAKQFNVDKQIIYNAKELARNTRRGNDLKEVKAIIEETISTKLIEQKNNKATGEETFTFETTKPLSPKEIDELAGVDNITRCVSMSWLKSHKNGVWTYSICTKVLVDNFYSKDELSEKLKELFPNITPTSIPVVKSTTDKGLFIYIGDDHCGLVLKNSLFKAEYSGKTYVDRLLQIVQEVKNLNQVFEDVYVINLGDEMDGYNQKTTRYDHTLDSLSNKEQFDIYVTARTIFYNDLFMSGITSKYRVVNLNNSNHTGLGFSYMATKAVNIYLEAKFPEVEVSHIAEFITSACYGNHIINLCHGKDEKYMKSGWPLNLDLKTDLWLKDYTERYIKNDKELDSNKTYWISSIKADLHKYNVNVGKSGRYVNVPSISSGSAWIEHNFGASAPGALLEIVKEDSPNITSIPIWF